MNLAKPYSAACDNNRDPILAIVAPLFAGRRRVLEIGSGTGQHAVYFGASLPHLEWLTSDLPEHHAGIRQWIGDAALTNVSAPIALDVTDNPWPVTNVDTVFSANTAHIMAWPAVVAMLAGVGRLLADGGLFVLYGPFNYGGHYTSASNASFDQWLKARDPHSGIRDFEAVAAVARAHGLELLADHAMPANNRTLVWVKASK